MSLTTNALLEIQAERDNKIIQAYYDCTCWDEFIFNVRSEGIEADLEELSLIYEEMNFKHS